MFYGIDESKPAPEAFTYDATNSSPAVIAVYWDARAAVEAGATGFTVQANTKADGGGDNYNSTIAKTLLVDEEGVYDAATFNQLEPGADYYLRVRANYPNSVYSKWVYLENSTFVTLAAPEITKTVIGAYGISLFWSPVTNATGYVVEYKTASSNWTAVTVEKGTSLDLNGLTPETAYSVRIKATKGDLASAYSAEKALKTIAKAEFPISLSSAEEMYLLFLGQDLLTAGPEDKVLLTADIDLTGKEIGEIAKFGGIFDGQGHTLKNLVTNHPLFTINTGTIQNVVLDASCKFTVETPVFGAFCAQNMGTIDNVTNNADLEYAINDADESSPILLGGIAGESTGPIKNSVNNGAVSVNSKAGLYACGVSGIAAYQGGAAIEGCTNNGAVTMTSLYTSGKTVVVADLGKAVPCIGGVVSYCGVDFTMDNCKNYGKVTFTQTAIDESPTPHNLNRHMLGGLVGATHGDITNSMNAGDVVITGKTTDGKTYTAWEYNYCMGGLAGGEYYVSGDGTKDVTNIINCSNSGKITVAVDPSKANSTLGGIVGWPCEESKSTVVTDKCTNSGDIVVSGTAKVRMGGIHGGSGKITNCKNTGNITVSSIGSASVVGLVAGFHSGGYTYDYNEAYGTLTVDCALNGAGALIGNIGNAKHSNTGKGCKVNANLKTIADVANIGLIVGVFNGTSNAITLGTEDEPIKILGGEVNGTAVTSGNYAGFLYGPTGSAESHKFITAFGE